MGHAARFFGIILAMNKWVMLAGIIALSFGANAAWYWPFGEDEEPERPRMSDLVEPVSVLVDEAADLAADGKVGEAVEKCRAALAELDRIEAENADRAALPEFNTIKNKRAYITATIDSLRLNEAQDNARPVAISDTTELQKKYDAKYGKQPEPAAPAAVGKPPAVVGEPAAARQAEPPKRPLTKLEQAVQDLEAGDYEAVRLAVAEILDEKPSDVAALNLRAAVEAASGNLRAAEATLDYAIQTNPRNHYAYYNMARLMLTKKNKSGAKRYYETGQVLGGPTDEELEEALK